MNGPIFFVAATAFVSVSATLGVSMLRLPSRIDATSLIRLCYAGGASSVELVRADPSLLTELQLGAFVHAYWRRRALRRAALVFARLGTT